MYCIYAGPLWYGPYDTEHEALKDARMLADSCPTLSPITVNSRYTDTPIVTVRK